MHYPFALSDLPSMFLWKWLIWAVVLATSRISKQKLWADSVGRLLSLALCVCGCLCDRQWNIKSLSSQSANARPDTWILFITLSLFLCVGFRCFPPKFLSWIVFLLGLHVDQKVHPRRIWSLIPSSCRLKRQSGAIPCLNLPMVSLAQMPSFRKSKRKGKNVICQKWITV